jgi:pantetheine-phosphate adenylyltransferase
MSSPESHALFPGSFDPVTVGHLNVLARMQRIFPRVTVVVASQPDKEHLFDVEERVALIQQAVAGLIPVVPLEGLIIDECRRMGASTIVRGVRSEADFEYERQMALANRQMAPEVETLLIVAAAEHSHISSSLVRQIARMGGDVSSFVPSCVLAALERLLGGGEKSAAGRALTANPVQWAQPSQPSEASEPPQPGAAVPPPGADLDLPPSLRPPSPPRVQATPIPPLPPPPRP